MTIKTSTALSDARLDQIETTIGTSPNFIVYAGSAPANCAAADTGTTLATIALPSDWLLASSSRVKDKNGTWTVNASATGTATHFRIKSSGGTTHMQGTCTAAGGGGDAILNSTTVTSGQPVTVTAFSLNENAHA